jgi:hypothetical protein
MFKQVVFQFPDELDNAFLMQCQLVYVFDERLVQVLNIVNVTTLQLIRKFLWQL